MSTTTALSASTRRAPTIGLWVASIALAAPVGFGGVAKLTGDPAINRTAP